MRTATCRARGREAGWWGVGTRSSTDPSVADQLLAKIEEISKIFREPVARLRGVH
jgi:hypothetical protein